MVTDQQVIGIDLGGTAIKLARFSIQGDMVAELERPTPQPAVPGAVTMALCEAVETLDPNREAALVGVGLPGPMDADASGSGVHQSAGLVGGSTGGLVEPRLNRKVTLANDGNCAVMGEAWMGAAAGCQNAVLLTLGTGVGGGVLLNGSLFTGHNGAAAEPGLIGIETDGPPCNSGNRGSLEQFASIAALRRLSDGRDPRELASAADAGEPKAQEIWTQYGRRLGVGISSLVYILTPELVLLGGGLAGASRHFLPAVREEVQQRVQAVSREGLRIEACSLGNGAGRLGAARLAWQRLGGMMADT